MFDPYTQNRLNQQDEPGGQEPRVMWQKQNYCTNSWHRTGITSLCWICIYL